MTERTLLLRIQSIEKKVSEVYEKQTELVENQRECSRKQAEITHLIDELKQETFSFYKNVKTDFTPLYLTDGINKRVEKFEGLWDWLIKIVFGVLVLGMLALLGIKK